MRKTSIILVVLLAVCWQAVAVAGQKLLSDHADGVAHAVLHWENEGHQHHDDGTFDVNDSDEAARHVAVDGGGPSAAVLPASLAVAVPYFTWATHPRPRNPSFSSPFLEGPRRPPRLTA